MEIVFEKYHGTGNDFIMIDDADKLLDTKKVDWVKKIAKRKFGIGADGVILIRPHLKYDFEMIFFNPDGSQSFCGNGSRCAVAFAVKLGYVKQNTTTFLSTDGVHNAIVKEGLIALQMNDVNEQSLIKNDYYINTGSPHYITYVNDAKKVNVFKEGRKIRYSDTYKDSGVNVNFVQEINNRFIFVRTYERGVEDETYSCGTGVTASALSFALKNNIKEGEIKVETIGGELSVSFKQNGSVFTDIWLKGPATYVFKGEIEI
jgi:diaminopimelate epimerase